MKEIRFVRSVTEFSKEFAPKWGSSCVSKIVELSFVRYGS